MPSPWNKLVFLFHSEKEFCERFAGVTSLFRRKLYGFKRVFAGTVSCFR